MADAAIGRDRHFSMISADALLADAMIVLKRDLDALVGRMSTPANTGQGPSLRRPIPKGKKQAGLCFRGRVRKATPRRHFTLDFVWGPASV